MRKKGMVVGQSIGVYLPHSLVLKAREEAEVRGSTVSEVVTRALSLYFLLKEVEPLLFALLTESEEREVERLLKRLREALEAEKAVAEVGGGG